MDVPKNVLNTFAKTIHNSIDKAIEESEEGVTYAEVTYANGDDIRVKFSGSDIDTPAVSLVSVSVGDRVIVSTKNNECTITGNLTNRSASLTQVEMAGKTASSYIEALRNGDILIHKENNSNAAILITTSSTAEEYARLILSDLGVRMEMDMGNERFGFADFTKDGLKFGYHDLDDPDVVTASIEQGGIDIDGSITVEGHNSPVGTIITGSKQNLSVVADINRKTEVSFTLPKGTWMINAWAGFPGVSGATGCSCLEISDGFDYLARCRVPHTVNNYISPSCSTAWTVLTESQSMSLYLSSHQARTGVEVFWRAVRIA